MTTDSATRRITLCADDYGISPAVNRGIRELILLRRLNATSVMMVGPAIDRDAVDALLDVTRGSKCAIGLHTTLTAPFYPLTLGFRPLRDGLFLPFATLLRDGLLRRLDAEMIELEVAAQIEAFIAAFGRAPDYVDGHQHAHLFPQVRDGFLAAVARLAPNAWVRQCGRAIAPLSRLSSPKALLLDSLSDTFKARATKANLKFNSSFDGAYDFARRPNFRDAMGGFLDTAKDGGLVMCHPGFVDDILVALDPLTDQRTREYEYLASDAFPADLKARNMTLR